MSRYKDELWLTDKRPLATEAEVEEFCERVAICTQDFELTEKEARELSLAIIRRRK